MPKIDFTKVDDAQDFSPLPEGVYRCRIAKVEETTTQAGDEMWRLRFEVSQGPFEGRFVFDNAVFNEVGLRRVKLLCSCLGLDVSGELEVTPAAIIDGSCDVTVTTEDYVDDEGKTKARNVVPFAGFKSADNQDDGDDDTPF